MFILFFFLFSFQLLSHSLFGSLREATVPQAANNGEREEEESSSTSSGGKLWFLYKLTVITTVLSFFFSRILLMISVNSLLFINPGLMFCLAGNGTATRRRRQPVAYNLPVRSTRRRTNSDRQMAPLETIIQEFIINLSGFDFDPAVLQAQGSPM